jgi:HD-GYP domain-containing protein (c-di-GMP phosphodiesterase class II)
MPPYIHRLETLREEAIAASEGLSAGQQALVDALHDLQVERGRAADGYRAVVQSLTAALEARDGYTSDHSDEVQTLAVAVAAALGLDEDAIAEVQAVAILHDVGKIGIPDRILHKAGSLDDEEWALMREHPVIGERILLASRIVLACDAWNALVSDRALLEEWATDAVLAVAASDEHGGWLLEVFADEATADLALIEPAARALVLHCLYGGVPSDLSRSRAISAAARADTFA